jgi:DNA-binding NtrC family response regulator
LLGISILEPQKRTNISRQDLARMLGVDPKTLRARLKELSLASRATRG